ILNKINKKKKNNKINNKKLTEHQVVNTMHERKAKMAEMAEGFIALPGGAGTLEEWSEVFTWSQLGYHAKPCRLLNVNNFFDPLIAMLDHTIKQGFTNDDYREMIMISSDPKALLEKMDSYTPSYAVKWS